jgi:exonuclease VII small subunit
MSSLSADRVLSPILYRRLFHKRLLQDRISVLEREGDALRGVLPEYERTMLAREATIVKCESVVREREQTIVTLEDTIRRYEDVISGLESVVRERDQALAALDAAGKRAVVGELARQSLEMAPETSQADTYHRGLSAAEADCWLGVWQKIAAKYSNAVLNGGQRLIEPYLVERVIHDRLGRLIIATVEGRAW